MLIRQKELRNARHRKEKTIKAAIREAKAAAAANKPTKPAAKKSPRAK